MATLLAGGRPAEYEPAGIVQRALLDADLDVISFAAEISPSGRAVLHLHLPGTATEMRNGPHPSALILVEGSVPEPWRRLPDPTPEAAPSPSADLALLERTLRSRLPDAGGVTEAEIAAAEARLGIALPDELKTLYRVQNGWSEHFYDAFGCELFPLDEVHIITPSRRRRSWRYAAREAVVTPADAAVQGVVGSPGWIAFGHDGGGERIAIDLTPGPRGHLGQIIMLARLRDTGAYLLADSLTDYVTHPRRESLADPNDLGPAVAHVNDGSLTSIEAAADPALEVLSIGVWEGEPFSLAPLTGSPRLRTLSAYPGTLADPLEIADLTGLEFLEISPEDWRVLLDAEAVPPSLKAAAIETPGVRHPVPVAEVANEILGLWGRPLITRTTVEGDLGPV
ncbi:SMI1/KNR4 family protein [Actinomadura barringtoniae]|uniref:SMI1/KNR4 family protein n=1 Tax=Actinomadura barringtoniae TaxID=1427535 RepID=A0A939T6D6_9ACTN|nr:SMI1/KNR4 family protein [Actinomadura barringtoniae]MBO2451808.1 SMI1/KNR4 family protein [Actinomadura barringtoniae]